MATLKNKNFFWKGKCGPLLIAEIGGNHEGDFEYAKKLTKLAINSGVDVVKFQIYSGDTLVNKRQSPKRHKHFKKFQLSKKQHIYLAEMCIKNGIKYLASVWDLDTLSWIDKYLSFYKIGSGDLTCYPIIKKLAKRGKPIILSTGLSDLKEVNSSIKFLRKENKIYKLSQNLAVLQCTSSYPTIDSEANLNVIKTYLKQKNITVGYSDHTLGNTALLTAFTLGAQVMEFHFTDTRKNKIFRDHKVSLTKEETKELIRSITRVKILLGNTNKIPTKCEIKSKHVKSFRRATFFSRDLSKGYEIKEKDLVFLRPNVGLDARETKKVIGRKLRRNVKKFDKIMINKNV
tara:strand:+ start:8776 stop:9810 length:1035 start_codon:yes stop_codon:yes gene_type:complete